MTTYFDIIPKDILTHTTPFISGNYISNIERELTEIFGDKYNELKEIMINEQCVISGSFVLKHINSEFYPEDKWNGDIDIYLSGKEHIHSIYGDDFRDYKSPYDIFRKFLSTIGFKHNDYEACSRYGSTFSEDSLFWVNEYKRDETTIQLIYCNVDKNVEDLTTFIINEFDFSICKNVFAFTKSQPYLYIDNIKDIKDKKIKFNYVRSIISSVKRLKKYIDRGYELYDSDDKLEQMKNIMNLLINQYGDEYDPLNKYESDCLFQYNKDSIIEQDNIKSCKDFISIKEGESYQCNIRVYKCIKYENTQPEHQHPYKNIKDIEYNTNCMTCRNCNKYNQKQTGRLLLDNIFV